MSDDSGSALDPDKIPRRRGLHIRDIKEEAPEPEHTVGTELRAAREAAGKELNEVAAALRIKPEHLSALEAAEYDKLPAKTYVVGFVRQYAQQLGLNANELVERLKAELEGPEAEEEVPTGGKPETPSRRVGPVGTTGAVGGRPASAGGEPRLPVTSIAIVVILLLVVIFGGWYLTRPAGGDEATADKEAETGSKAAPAVPDESQDGAEQRTPDPPVIPASAGTGAARSGGSLTALLPGADRLPETAGEAEQTPERLKMPDAAALAVPIENSESADGEVEVAARNDVAESRLRDPVETAMPQPNLALRTSRSHLPGVPEEAAGEADEADAAAGEPALEDIEAEGIGGGADDMADQASTPAPEGRPQLQAESRPEAQEQPRTRQPPAEEPADTGAATVKSRVTLRVRSSTWVRVEDADGQVIMERDMRSGDSFRAPDVKGLYLVTKDAGAIELLLDGESIGRAGRSRQVLTGLLLAPDQLRQRVAQNITPEIR